ncbi:MAG: hypothetical protein L3K16_09750 [Thermoplasmata archaeon]|nr:hypothetical protein [Thermoplasmata archaeon]
MEWGRAVLPLAIALVALGFALTNIGVVSSQSPYLATSPFWEAAEINVGLVVDVVGLMTIRWVRDHPYSLRPLPSQF